MTIPTNWLAAFPILPAREAVEALREGWTYLASRPRAGFNPETHEGPLTKRLKVYVELYAARERGVLGMWAAEDIIGDICPTTGSLVEERRTDIVYGWNDDVQDIKLVFEFKRLGKQKSHRDHYLLDQGLGRFVTGIYSRRQAVAAMVGVLLDPEPEIVPPIKAALSNTGLATALRLRPNGAGQPYTTPSRLFANADFDTEHDRDPSLAPSHGHICVSHFFFAFGYPTSTVKPKKPSVKRKTSAKPRVSKSPKSP